MNKHKPTVNLISAVALDGSIGKQGKLLWKIPEDLEYYKSKTLDNVIIMGETTFDTLPTVALRGRTHVIVSQKYNEKEPNDPANNLDVVYATNPLHALSLAKNLAEKMKCDIYIAGGQSMYEQLMEFCEFALITLVYKLFNNADKHFPAEKFLSNFKLISESDWNGDDLRYKFTTYKNKNI